MKNLKKLTALWVVVILMLSMASAAFAEEAEVSGKEVYILFTSDVHCGIDQGFGYAGLSQIRTVLERKGCETILVDNGDSIQGETVGTVTNGEAIIQLMNVVGYDVAIPGNHEFDYSMDQFLKLVKEAKFKYISCNFTYKGEPVFDPYTIIEAGGTKIAFVGVTTPKSLVTSTPKNFQDENGEYVYGFMQDETGEAVYAAVQKAVDDARAEGADLVYVMAHLGLEEVCRPWTYADVISHTSGIDVLLDGHSHDTEQVVMKNKNGEDVPRYAVGTKLSCIGYSHIFAEGEILETGVWSWPNKESVQELFGFQNGIGYQVNKAMAALKDLLDVDVAGTDVDLTILDPVEKDNLGNPIRMVRRAETNLGDLCTDALRDQAGSDIAFVNGGGIRKGVAKGEVTYGEIIDIHPFGNMLCVIEVTGQQILDALEWGARGVPEENGGFLQVSGLTYEIHSYIDSGCIEDENFMFAGVEGERRVKNVMIGGEPIDPEKTYTLAGTDYLLLSHGDGFSMFDGAPLLQDRVKIDNQVLIDYIVDSLGGVIGEEYDDPYGQGRITIIEEDPAAGSGAESVAEETGGEA